MSSIFSKIISGEINAYKIAEDESHLAFLDINPLVEGHVLVIPKIENDYIFDLNDDAYLNLWAFAKKVAKKIKPNLDCNRIGIAVIGSEAVSYTHLTLPTIYSV